MPSPTVYMTNCGSVTRTFWCLRVWRELYWELIMIFGSISRRKSTSSKQQGLYKVIHQNFPNLLKKDPLLSLKLPSCLISCPKIASGKYFPRPPVPNHCYLALAAFWAQMADLLPQNVSIAWAWSSVCVAANLAILRDLAPSRITGCQG